METEQVIINYASTAEQFRALCNFENLSIIIRGNPESPAITYVRIIYYNTNLHVFKHIVCKVIKQEFLQIADYSDALYDLLIENIEGSLPS
jgi:hypothetical protein